MLLFFSLPNTHIHLFLNLIIFSHLLDQNLPATSCLMVEQTTHQNDVIFSLWWQRKCFYYIETELSGTLNHSSRSVTKDLMTSCELPRPWGSASYQSCDHAASIFRKESGRELVFSLTCHCVSCEVMASGRVFWCRTSSLHHDYVLWFYCVTRWCFIVWLQPACFWFSPRTDTKLWHNESGRCFRSALRHSPLWAGESCPLSRQNLKMTSAELRTAALSLDHITCLTIVSMHFLR